MLFRSDPPVVKSGASRGVHGSHGTGRGSAPQAPRPIDRDLRRRDRGIPRARPRPGDGGRVLLRFRRADQRLHGRVSDPESDPGARRRRGVVVGIRPRVHGAAREGRPQEGMARSLERVLAHGARARCADRPVHADRSARDRAVREPGRRQGACCRPRAGAVPDRRAPRRLWRDRRDPEQLRGVQHPGADAGRVEPRDHRRTRHRRAAGAFGATGSSTSTPSRS